jgi:small conductance mechanosensitive channel
MDSGAQFDKTELQRLMREQEIDAGTEREKEPISAPSRIQGTIMLVVAIMYLAVLIFGRFIVPADNEIMRSLDVFSDAESPNRLLRIASLALLTLSVSTILRFFIGRMANNSKLTKRTGRAVIDLLGNSVKYIAVLVLVFLILSALGVDTAELLAGLGILSLVLGLGVTSLVEDVVAGIFIIGEHLFDVGDIVVVDDFRGKILSIGIRSTQIEDDGGDILILRNSTIENLINMTNRASYAVCDIPVAPSESYAHVEEIIQNAHLETMKERYPEIEKGPFFLGLSEISESGAQIITFVAICQENTKYWIQRIMNRELKLLFDENGIQLGEPEDE